MSGLQIHHKRNLHIIRWSFLLMLIALAAAYAFFGYRWYNTGELSPLPMPVAAADDTVDESPVNLKQITEHKVAATEPRYLEIPSLNILKTRVTGLGVTANKMLDTPKNINDVGWYKKSATPGSGVGAVLIDGHNGGVSKDGVFAKINTLKAGDTITIERGDGKKYTYSVNDVRDMPLEWVNKVGMKEMMYSVSPEKEGLSLITCSGKWIPKQKVFDRRVLVRATLTR